MTWESIVAGVVVISGAALWYGLQVVALRDLRERPSVRGDNKLIWALGILCLPFFGSLAYLMAGPTSFIGRPAQRPVRRDPYLARSARPASVVQPSRDRVAGAYAASRRVRPDLAPRPAHRPRVVPIMAHDPVLGTDSGELLAAQAIAPRASRDAIRWPGTGYAGPIGVPAGDGWDSRA